MPAAFSMPAKARWFTPPCALPEALNLRSRCFDRIEQVLDGLVGRVSPHEERRGIGIVEADRGIGLMGQRRQAR